MTFWSISDGDRILNQLRVIPQFAIPYISPGWRIYPPWRGLQAQAAAAESLCFRNQPRKPPRTSLLNIQVRITGCLKKKLLCSLSNDQTNLFVFWIQRSPSLQISTTTFNRDSNHMLHSIICFYPSPLKSYIRDHRTYFLFLRLMYARHRYKNKFKFVYWSIKINWVSKNVYFVVTAMKVYILYMVVPWWWWLYDYVVMMMMTVIWLCK